MPDKNKARKKVMVRKPHKKAIKKLGRIKKQN